MIFIFLKSLWSQKYKSAFLKKYFLSGYRRSLWYIKVCILVQLNLDYCTFFVDAITEVCAIIKFFENENLWDKEHFFLNDVNSRPKKSIKCYFNPKKCKIFFRERRLKNFQKVPFPKRSHFTQKNPFFGFFSYAWSCAISQ